MTIKNNPGLKGFFIRLGATVVAVVLVIYLAKVWFIDPRLAVLPVQRPVSEQVDTSVKAIEELQAQVLSLQKEIKVLASTAQAPITAPIVIPTAAPTVKAPKEVVYVGSARSNKYHCPWCRWAKKISPGNLVTFRSVKDAKSQGYVPCKVCKPPAQDLPVRVARAPTAAPTVAAPAAGVTPISSITQASVGQKATLKGTITLVRIFKEAKGRTLKISDGTGTIDVLIWKKLYDQLPQRASLNPGMSLQVSGKIKSYQDKFQIEPGNSSDIQIAAKPVYKKIDTDGDGIPDTFILKGEAKESSVSPSTPEPKIPSNLLKATCTRIADGDTITVALSDGSIKKVRLVGIDTPECWRKEGGRWVSDPEPGGKEASDFTEKEVLGKTVYLDVDDEEPADHYGRTLALVYTNLSDAKKGPRYSLNAKLLQKGLAKVLFIPPSEFDPYSWK